MPRQRNVEVSIVCGGNALKEYRTTTPASNVAACIIESTEGQRFQCRFRNHLRQNVAVQTVIDGNEAGSVLVPKIWNISGSSSSVVLGGQYISSREIRPFQFARVMLADNEPDWAPDRSGIGFLEFRMWRVSNTRMVGGPSNPSHVNGEFQFMEGPVPETSKKDGFHQVALGELAQVSSSQTLAASQTGDFLDNADCPYAVFRFCYRPRALLNDMLRSGAALSNVASRSNPRNGIRFSMHDRHAQSETQSGQSRSQIGSSGLVKLEQTHVKLEDPPPGPIKTELEVVKFEDNFFPPISGPSRPKTSTREIGPSIVGGPIKKEESYVKPLREPMMPKSEPRSDHAQSLGTQHSSQKDVYHASEFAGDNLEENIDVTNAGCMLLELKRKRKRRAVTTKKAEGSKKLKISEVIDLTED